MVVGGMKENSNINIKQSLHNSNLGCRYGNEYMGVYCYADDISLLSLDLKKC